MPSISKIAGAGAGSVAVAVAVWRRRKKVGLELQVCNCTCGLPDVEAVFSIHTLLSLEPLLALLSHPSSRPSRAVHLHYLNPQNSGVSGLNQAFQSSNCCDRRSLQRCTRHLAMNGDNYSARGIHSSFVIQGCFLLIQTRLWPFSPP